MMLKVWVSKDGTQVFREEPFGKVAATWGPFTTMYLVDENSIVIDEPNLASANVHLSEMGNLSIYDEDYAVADKEFFYQSALTYLAGYLWHVDQEDKISTLADDIERNSSLSVGDAQALAALLSESGWVKEKNSSE